MTTIPKSHKHPLSVKFWAVLLFVMTIPMFGAAQNADQQADSSVKVYVPADLPDCMRRLDSILTPENKELIRSLEEKDFLSRTHFALGMWIRNKWGLWAGSRLATYFDEQGIHHPDDMSGVILRCYYHYVRGEKVNYQQMLRKERQEEERWVKKQEKSRQEEKERWEYEWRYSCDSGVDTWSEKENEAFLHLPFVADSVTGIQVYLRNRGDSIAEDLNLMEQSLNREPHRTPLKDELVRSNVYIYYGRNPNGRVKKMKINYIDKKQVEISFNSDGTVAHCRKRFTKTLIDEFYEYDKGHISREVVYWNDTLQSVTLYRFSDPYHCQKYHFAGRVWTSLDARSDTLSMASSTGHAVLSPEGQILATCWNACSLFQYDTLGREVLWIESIDGYTVSHCQVTVYDDERNVYYEYQGFGFLDATVLNTQGDELGSCCSKRLDTFDYDKTLFSYRYDRHGNWTHRYEKGKRCKRCKIRYY